MMKSTLTRHVILILSLGWIHAQLAVGDTAEGDAKTVTQLILLGHEGQGQSVLAIAIPRILASRGQEARVVFAKSGSSGISVARSEFQAGSRKYSLTHFAGPEDAEKALKTGAPGVDGVILVVSAQDGPMPQTREQIYLARQAGVRPIVVFMDRCDLVDNEELLNLVELELRELLSSAGYDGDETPIVRGSSVRALESGDPQSRWGKPILELMDAVASSAK